MNFENNILKKIDKERFQKNILENTEMRERYLKMKKEKVDIFRPNMDDFVDIIPGGKKEIDQDKKEVALRKKIFDAEKEGDPEMRAINEIAEIYEGVLIDQIEKSEWFGSRCQIQITSEYDDIKHGIDGIGIFQNEEEGSEYIGFGIDVTFASDIKILTKKLDSIKAVIRAKSLPRVKYFTDENDNRVSLQVPKVIVGARLASAEKLIHLWASQAKDKREQLAQHPMQSKLIIESLWQLKYFYDYAKSIENDEAAYAYGKLYNTFYDIFEEKQDILDKHWLEIQDDSVFQAIKEYTGNA